MRLRSLLLLLVALLSLASVPAHAAPTPTEAAAIAAAEHDHTTYSLPPDKLAKAQHLETTRVLEHFGGALWGILSVWLTLQLGFAARFRNVAVNVTKNRWRQAYLFLLLVLLFAGLLSLPLDLYSQHVQRAYGLSVQSWPSWWGDLLKTFALIYPFGGLFLMLLFWLIRKFPRTWWVWCWGVITCLSLLTVNLAPTLLDPIYNKFEPLSQSNPALVQKLEEVVARGKGIDIPPERMFLMKASAKVTTLNAYVTGFGSSKRVVVWDTSIEKATPDEVLFIFGHEMGHYVLGHIVRGIIFTIISLFLTFFLGFHLFQWLLRRYGTKWRIPAQDNWAALYVMLLVLSVIGFVSEPVESAFSRAQEHAADVYGEEVVHGIIANPQATGQAAFQLLGENSYVDPSPNAFVEFWTGSHPPIWFRAAFARRYDPFAPGNQPKYFNK